MLRAENAKRSSSLVAFVCCSILLRDNLGPHVAPPVHPLGAIPITKGHSGGKSLSPTTRPHDMSDAKGAPDTKRVKELEARLQKAEKQAAEERRQAAEERRQAAEREVALQRQLDALAAKSTAAPPARTRLPLPSC